MLRRAVCYISKAHAAQPGACHTGNLISAILTFIESAAGNVDFWQHLRAAAEPSKTVITYDIEDAVPPNLALLPLMVKKRKCTCCTRPCSPLTC